MNANYEAPDGWLDDIQPGEHVMLRQRQPLGFSGSAYPLVAKTVDKATATTVTVDGRKYRRGPGRSEWAKYRDEGREIGGRDQYSWSNKLFPDTPHNRAVDVEQRALVRSHTTISRLIRRVDRLRSDMLTGASDDVLARLSAVLDELGVES